MNLPEERTIEAGGARLRLYRRGEREHRVSRTPLEYGLFHELATGAAILRFDLRGHLRRMRATSPWPSDAEWLKRSEGDDWTFYAGGGLAGSFTRLGAPGAAVRFRVPAPYSEIVKAVGDYYLPCPEYPSNSPFARDPFTEPGVRELIDSWPQILAAAAPALAEADEEAAEFLARAERATPGALAERAGALHDITGGRVGVLPPDARHADYDVVPLPVSTGCLYKCRFCAVKSAAPFASLTPDDVRARAGKLRDHFGPELMNRCALFLGDQDALAAAPKTLETAARVGFSQLELGRGYVGPARLVLFAGADSLLAATDDTLAALTAHGGPAHVNVGLESAHQPTLHALGKPLTAARVEAAFDRACELNERFENLEVTVNFLLGENLPEAHYEAIVRLTRGRFDAPRPKGAVYLSPLMGEKHSPRLLFEFNQLQSLSRLPMYLYLIQRL